MADVAHSTPPPKGPTRKPKRRPTPTARDLGIMTQKPKYPEYSAMSKRAESFTDDECRWPTDSPVNVEELVEAGLVYTGVGDCVRCYHCGGGLRNWEVGDRPMVEHARWYPECPHVLLVMGPNYAKKIAEGEIPLQDCMDSLTLETSQPDSQVKAADDDFDDGTAIQALCEMGYKNTAINKAIRIFKHRKGHQHVYTGANLCEILIELEENPGLEEEYINVDCGSQTATTSQTSSMNKDDLLDDDADIDKLQEENERLKEKNACKICLDKRSDVIFLPCGHMVSCGQCAPVLEKCPICRKTINGRIKALFAVVKR